MDVTWTPAKNVCGVCGQHSLLFTTDYENVDEVPSLEGPRESRVGLMRCEACGYQGWVHTATFA